MGNGGTEPRRDLSKVTTRQVGGRSRKKTLGVLNPCHQTVLPLCAACASSHSPNLGVQCCPHFSCGFPLLPPVANLSRSLVKSCCCCLWEGHSYERTSHSHWTNSEPRLIAKKKLAHETEWKCAVEARHRPELCPCSDAPRKNKQWDQPLGPSEAGWWFQQWPQHSVNPLNHSTLVQMLFFWCTEIVQLERGCIYLLPLKLHAGLLCQWVTKY